MKRSNVTALLMSGILLSVSPTVVLAYDHLLRDPKTHTDCNNAKHMLRMAGPDTHSHLVKDIRAILKRCDIAQKKVHASKKKQS